jgi:NAD(P)-dependent dehydrogenase (short-subunit alcohol dehydrogenase family)
MTDRSLKNKKIIISAGASGIGWATTKVCISRGAQVFLCDVNDKLINKIQKTNKYKNKIFAYECDASNESQVIDFFSKILKKTKKIDALINNVGIAGPTGILEKLDSEEWERTLKVNVVSHFYFTKQAIPIIKKNKKGSIINLSSGAGIMGFPLRSPYAASKWAIVGLTKTLAMELGKFNIRVNAICPGTIKGHRMKRVVRDKAKYLKVSQNVVEKEFISMASMNSWIYEEDIGKMCAFLISGDSERISGQIIGVDGNSVRLD